MEMQNVTSGTHQNSSIWIDEFQWLDLLCREALHSEAMAWPKPGLVTPRDSGSHHDMDITSFHASINSLKGYFGQVAQSAATRLELPALRLLGIEAEQNMLRATGGVNTHRGAIFNLGLFAAACARRKADYSLTGLTCGEIVRYLWGNEILRSGITATNSHGSLVNIQFAAGGAHHEAGGGFPGVYRIGLPALRRLLTVTDTMETALIGTLLTLMEHITDTNLLWRGGEEGLAYVQKSAGDFNSAGGVEQPFWRNRLVAMHHEFVSRNLSPGGSADLLAATLVAFHVDVQEGIQ